jgi:predicted phosphodiesterase
MSLTNSSTLRQEGETALDYKYRICRDKELLGLNTWQSVSDVLNKEFQNNWTESTYRKWFTAFDSGVQFGKEQIGDKEYLQEIEEKTLQFQKERFKYQDQKREYTNTVRQQARFEHLKDEIHKAIKDLNKYKPLEFKENKNKSSTLSKQAIALFSDWHFGADFSNSLNTFNPTVFKQRVEKLVSKIITYAQKNEVSIINLAILGDMVSGLIHVSTRVQASEDVIRQIQIVSETLAEVIAKLADQFNEVRVVNVIGNHSRTIANKTESVLKENFENLIPWYLQSRLKDFANVTIINNADGYVVDEIDGEKIVYVHGDLDYVSSTAKTLPQMLGIVPKYIFAGHIHHNTVKEHGRTTVITNGSLVGVDDYALSKRFYAEPMQKLLVLDGSDIECSYDIKL